jgi:16S rRNA (guanine527-N7)-methyltransferase
MRITDLPDICRQSGIDLNDEMIRQLERYMELLMEWNEKINLTAIKEPEEIVEKHFYDCLLPLSSGQIHGRCADIGSGAGFPGLVWKIADPELSMMLVEPTGKRCTFLKTVISELGLKEIEVINQRSEDYVREARESFDVVTARAVANLRVLCELCVPLVKKGGLFVPMKGSSAIDEVSEAAHAMKVLGCKVENIQETSLPGGDIRNNIFCRKTASTQPEYPRHYGRIKKQPL